MQSARLAFLASLAVLISCVDAPTDPRASAIAGPSFSRSGYGSVACTTTGATVVSTEPTLRAALAAAQPGDVVAIDGMVTLTSNIEVEVPEGVTLTCASAGSGVTAASGRYSVIDIRSPNSTVSGLVIHGGKSEWPIFIQNGGRRSDVTGVRIEGNSVDCGWAGCAFVVGAPATNIVGNTFGTVHRTSTGIHLQRGGANGALRIDGSRITDNEVVANEAVGAPSFGAIRPRDGTDVVVRGNVIRGPWSNGIATTEMEEGFFEHNTVEAATCFGVFFALIFNRPITVRSSLFRANNFTSIGGAAVFAQRACSNVFVANRLTPKAGHPTIAFAATTGANAVLGNVSGIEDNGNQDCDGDTVADPNTISGKTRRGGYAGEIIGTVMQTAGRDQAQ